MIRTNLLKPRYGAGAGQQENSAGTIRIGRAILAGGTILFVAAGALIYHFRLSRTNAEQHKPPTPPAAQETPRAAAPPKPASPPSPEEQANRPATSVEGPRRASKAGSIAATALSVEQRSEGLLLTLHTSAGELRYGETRYAHPSRLAVDLETCRLLVPGDHRSHCVENRYVRRVRLGQLQDNPPICRIVLDLRSWPRYQIEPGPGELRIRVWNEAGGR